MSLKLSSFEEILSSLCCSVWVISTILSPGSWSTVLYYIICYWFPLSVIVFFSSDWFCLIFSKSLLKISLYFSILLLSIVSILLTISMYSMSGKLLTSVSLGFFLGFYFVLSFGTYSSVSSFCLTLGVCFYELGRTATSPSPEGVALCGTVYSVDCLYLVALAG